MSAGRVALQRPGVRFAPGPLPTPRCAMTLSRRLDGPIEGNYISAIHVSEIQKGGKAEKADSMTTTVREKGQITIPAEVRRAAHLEEGDPVEVEIVEEGILLRPRKVIDATQAWFWTPAWQESLRRSIAQIEAGEGVAFADDDAFRTALDG